jgi:hypothetical protein
MLTGAWALATVHRPQGTWPQRSRSFRAMADTAQLVVADSKNTITKRYTLRSLVRRSAKHHAEMTVDHAKRVFSRALEKLDTSQGDNPTLRAMIVHLLQQLPPSELNATKAEGKDAVFAPN